MIHVAVLEPTQGDPAQVARAQVEEVKPELKGKVIEGVKQALHFVTHKKRVNLLVLVTLAGGVCLLDESRNALMEEVKKLPHVSAVAKHTHYLYQVVTVWNTIIAVKFVGECLEVLPIDEFEEDHQLSQVMAHLARQAPKKKPHNPYNQKRR